MGKIEWTEKTWNPVLGCKPVSPGCANCYAEQMSGRCAAMGNADYEGLTRRGSNGKTYLFTGEFRELPDRLDEPLRRKKPTTYFVNSMSDLFGNGVSNEFIAAVFGIMAACPQHRFQVLTKRANRLADWFDWIVPNEHDVMHSHAFEQLGEGIENMLRMSTMSCAWPLPQIHVGVSVEDRKHGFHRVDQLRQVPAAVRFLSIEPLLEDLGEIDLTGIHWVIVGGESGHGARPMHPEWVRSIRDQCVASGVPFFFKQWGEWAPSAHDNPYPDLLQEMVKVGKKNAGRVLDGRTWNEVPK